MTDEQMEAVLCYVEGSWAYFTTQALGKQWGDDWDDAPYEHNAGTPYLPWREKDAATWEIIRLPWEGPFEPPCAGVTNSQFSVRDINAGAVAWLRPCQYDSREHRVCIQAGTTVRDFLRLIKEAGGTAYLPA